MFSSVYNLIFEGQMELLMINLSMSVSFLQKKEHAFIWN